MEKCSTISAIVVEKKVRYYIQIKNSLDGDVMSAQTDDVFITHDEYIKLFTERNKRIKERIGKKVFTISEYSALIEEDILIMSESKRVEETIKDNDSNPEIHQANVVSEKAVIVDPFTSDLSCEG